MDRHYRDYGNTSISGDFYLHQQIDDISGHLLYQDVNHSQYLSLGSGQRGGVNVLLRLRVSLSRIVTMNLGNQQQLYEAIMGWRSSVTQIPI